MSVCVICDSIRQKKKNLWVFVEKDRRARVTSETPYTRFHEGAGESLQNAIAISYCCWLPAPAVCNRSTPPELQDSHFSNDCRAKVFLTWENSKRGHRVATLSHIENPPRCPETIGFPEASGVTCDPLSASLMFRRTGAWHVHRYKFICIYTRELTDNVAYVFHPSDIAGTQHEGTSNGNRRHEGRRRQMPAPPGRRTSAGVSVAHLQLVDFVFRESGPRQADRWLKRAA